MMLQGVCCHAVLRKRISPRQGIACKTIELCNFRPGYFLSEIRRMSHPTLKDTGNITSLRKLHVSVVELQM